MNIGELKAVHELAFEALFLSEGNRYAFDEAIVREGTGEVHGKVVVVEGKPDEIDADGQAGLQGNPYFQGCGEVARGRERRVGYRVAKYENTLAGNAVNGGCAEVIHLNGWVSCVQEIGQEGEDG